jgi:4-hydroxy-tetrahydrodipicolinate synthase
MILPNLFTAVVTPFSEGKIDFKAFEKILRSQMDAGIEGIVVAGSTGEGLSLSFNEHKDLLQCALNHAKGSMLIFSSCCAFTTKEALRLAEMAGSLSVDGLMCSIPPYLRPSQKGIVEHFKTINSLNIPLMLYSVPQRTGTDFTDETLHELASYSSFKAFKDASPACLDRVLRLSGTLSFKFFCGNDKEMLAFTANGGSGSVSVASNVVPSLIKRLQLLALEGDNPISLHRSLLALYEGLCLENNPTAVKYFMSLLKLCSSEVRLPLFELSDSSKKILDCLIKTLQ